MTLGGVQTRGWIDAMTAAVISVAPDQEHSYVSEVIVRRVGRMMHLRVSRQVRASPERVWAVMSDHPRYADVASNIAKVEVLSGDGLGMVRRCYDPKGASWTETCDLFEPRRVFGFEVDTGAPDYPYPIASLKGRWSVEPVGDGAVFRIDIEAKPAGNALQRFLFTRLAGVKFKGILKDLADRWAARMEV